MRKYLLIVALLFSTIYSFGQAELGISYTIGVPLQEMAKHIQPAHQAVLAGNYRLHIKAHPQFWVGLELGTGAYAHKTIEQTFKFSDGSSTRTDVQYTSSIAYANAVLRYDVPLKGKVTPYVKFKGGYTGFFTNVFIEDPSEPDGCKALDKDLVLKDYSPTYSYGGGLRIFIDKSKSGKNSYLLDLGVESMRGNNVDYLNVKHMGEHQHDNSGNSESKPLSTQFINVNTQNVHEHQLAEVYNSPIRLLQIRLGFVMKFEKSASSK